MTIMRQLNAYSGRVLFDHLPKTGGSAIAAWLERELGSGCVSPHIDGEHQALIRQFGGQYSVLCGHVSYTKGEDIDPRYRYATLLREPVDRILSWLYFVLTNHTDTELRGLVPLVRRFLDSDGAELHERLREHLSNTYVEHFCRLLGDGTEDAPRRLHNALAALRRYDVVGIYADMPRFLAAMGALLQLPAPRELARINVTVSRPGRQQISAALRARLVELNQLDLQFYEAACAMETQAMAAPLSALVAPPWTALASAPGAASMSELVATPLAKTTPWQRYERAPAHERRTDQLTIGPVRLREGPSVDAGATVHFDLELRAARAIPQLLLGIHLKDSASQLAYGVHSGMLRQLQAGLDAGRHRVSYRLQLALPAGKYTAGFAVVEILADGQRELAWHDNLCSFEVGLPAERRFLGYADLSARLLFNAAPPLGDTANDAAIEHAPGGLQPRSAPAAIRCGHRQRIDVNVANLGASAWHSGGQRPVMLSYHWLDADGAMVLFDGVRTPLPDGGLVPGGRSAWHIDVDAPAQPGEHTLVLTALQERVGWFEQMGFEPARLPVRVIA